MTERDDRCVHYRGVHGRETCEAGVNYRELAGGDGPGWVARLPCTALLRGPGATAPVADCPHRRLPTPEEIAAEEAETAAAVERARKAAPFFAALRARHKGRSGAGVDDCPACGAPGALRWSIARVNGHIHARCATPGCLNFMQ